MYYSKQEGFSYSFCIPSRTPNKHKGINVVNPLYKEGNKSQISNYRTTSLLTDFSKVFEAVIFKKLNQHLHHNILVSEQLDFERVVQQHIW
jgi:fructose-1,6-bisphosphatase/inositol monophosphatase family enzyme